MGKNLPRKATVAGAGCRRPATDLAGLTTVELLQYCLGTADETGWSEFVGRIQPLIASVVGRTLHRWTYPQPYVVDDLVQETYLRLCANHCKGLRECEFADDNALFGYLKVVASNVVQDHFRTKCSQKRGGGKAECDLDPFTSTIASGEDVAAKAQHAVLLDQIKQCLRQTPDSQSSRNYQIFKLYFEAGLTAKAISRLSGICLTEKGVESAVVRMTRLLKTKLGQAPSMA